MKNEAENLPRVLGSIKNCVDKIYIADTGSTDDSIQIAEGLGACVSKFEWVHDFSKARQFVFDQVKEDYIFWIDCDDVLENPEAFAYWRDNAMSFADYWMATYHYSSDASGKALCSFARERVIKNHKGLKWKYFIHEGIMPVSPFGTILTSYASTWAIRHKRTEADLIKDRSRNLNVFDANKGKLDSRLKFYHGKELFEAELNAEAISVLSDAVALTDLEMHDRLLGLQYLCYALMKQGQLNKSYYARALNVAMQGVQLAPHRAEFWCVAGDCFIKLDKFLEALPMFEAAKKCTNASEMGKGVVGPLFSYGDCYGVYPRNVIGKIYAKAGDFPRAKTEVEETLKVCPNPEAEAMLLEINKFVEMSKVPQNAADCSDIVISCPPQTLYEWDREISKTRGIGGSETAACELAHELKKLTNRKVIVFNVHKETKICDGVEYRSVAEAYDYFQANRPALHFAWRHTARLTKAKTLVWSHDLLTQGVLTEANYDKVLCLSPFHKRFMHAMTGLPLDKMEVFRNGVTLDKFEGLNFTKERGKVVFPSSPDRGVDNAIKVMKRVVEDIPEAKLHVYYGFDNMRKVGRGKEADALEAELKSHPFVVFHGNLQQNELMKELSTAQAWLYPTNFLETFCITALEALGCKVWPIVRNYGALPDTLKGAPCTIIDQPCESESEVELYAQAVVDAIQNEKWKTINYDLTPHSWESVAKEVIDRWLTSST